MQLRVEAADTDLCRENDARHSVVSLVHLLLSVSDGLLLTAIGPYLPGFLPVYRTGRTLVLTLSFTASGL